MLIWRKFGYWGGLAPDGKIVQKYKTVTIDRLSGTRRALPLGGRITVVPIGAILLTLSMLSIRQIGYWRNSKTLWTHASQVSTNNYIAYCQVGNAYKGEGNWPAAITNYQRAVELAPGWFDPALLLAQAYEAVGDLRAAVDRYNRALAINPDSTVALNNLAWILATARDSSQRDGSQAVDLAQRACKISGQSRPIMIGTLAAAYAENGQFEEAVRTAQRAADQARALGDDELAQRNLQLKQQYAERKPFRQE